MADWKKTFYGWTAYVNGHRLAVRRYRRGSGRGFVFVSSVDSSASTSPAQAHISAARAKAEAEAMTTVGDSLTQNRSRSCIHPRLR
jgi:hypothetical protein